MATIPITQVQTTVRPQDFLRRVGAEKVIRGAADQATVDYFRQQIRQGKPFEAPSLHLDNVGNVLEADGRHRALAHALERTERMPVMVKRNMAIVDKVMQAGESTVSRSGLLSKIARGAQKTLRSL